MRLVRFIGPVVGGGACRSPSPTRNGHVERGGPGIGGRPGIGGKAKTQETRWATRKMVRTKARKGGRIEAMVEVKEQAPEGKVGHREGLRSGRCNADGWK